MFYSHALDADFGVVGSCVPLSILLNNNESRTLYTYYVQPVVVSSDPVAVLDCVVLYYLLGSGVHYFHWLFNLALLFVAVTSTTNAHRLQTEYTLF